MSATLIEETSRRPSRRRRTPLARALRAELWAEQKGKCCYCGRATRLPSNREPSALPVATVEHRTSVANGGTDDRENLAISCAPCNNAKGDLDEAEFIEGLRLHGASFRQRPPGVTRIMSRVAKSQRRQGRRPSPERERAIYVGNNYVVMELAIREKIQEVAAARFREGGELHGQKKKWFHKRKVMKISQWEAIMHQMEVRIGKKVRAVSDARYPQIWGSERMPKARFEKSRSATCPLATFWPSISQDTVSFEHRLTSSQNLC